LNGGGTTTLTAAADAFVQDGASASSNFGSLSYLLMKNSAPGYNRETFVKFDLSGMGTVSQARIRVFAAADRSETVNLGVHGAAGAAWTEGGITWNSRPPTGASLGSTSVNGTTSQWHEIDVTSFVVAEKQAGRSVVTLVLRVPAESAAMIKAESREGSSGPELVVTHN
jgi:endoglucanase